MRVAVLVLIGVASVGTDAFASPNETGPRFPNLGFEDWFSSWDCYRSYVDYPTIGCDRLDIVSDVKFAGNHSLRGTRCWWDTAFSNMARAQLSDKPYIEVSWYERPANPANQASTGSADVTFFDRSGAYLKWTWSFSTGEVMAGDWTYHRVKVPVPAGGRYLEFAVFPGVVGDYYLDEVAVRQTDDPTGCINPNTGAPCVR